MAHVFHLPLSALTVPSRLKSHTFHGDRQYWAITVSDLVAGSGVKWESDAGRDGTGGRAEGPGELEMWGLTG